MLSMGSNSPYQHKSIRSAIQDEEHHIVRVNEEGTGKIYDLNLSHSTPYASPVTIKKKANGDPASKSNDVSKTQPADGTVAHQASGQNGIQQQQQQQHGQPTTSHGRRLLQLPQIVSRRNGNGSSAAVSSSSKGASANAAAGPSTAPVEMKALNSTSGAKAVGTAQHLPPPPLIGELPPSPPLEPEYRKGLGTDENVFDAAAKKAVPPPPSSPQLEEQGRGRIDPRRSTRKDSSSVPLSPSHRGDEIRLIRSRNSMREGSGASNASTAYLSANSHDGSDEDEGGERRRSIPSRYSTAPMVAEPDSLLHPSSAQGMDGTASSSKTLIQQRRPSPVSSYSSSAHGQPAVGVRQPAPTRRNTTGGSSPAQKKRPGSVGSTGTHASRRSSKERDILPASTTYEEPMSMQDAGPSAAPPLRTGDANLDEAIAKQYDQIRRQRETKKMRGTNAEAEQTQQQQHHHPQQQAGGQQQLDGGGVKGGAALIRAKSGKRMTEEEPKALIGNVIGEGHDNYVLMYNMLTGIRIGVSRCQAKVKRPLTDTDYTARHKFTFDIVGNELTPSAKYDFKFKDYAPWVFRELREYFHLDPADYLLSLTAKYILSELGSPGKSGSFFYFSRDYRFIIKTIRHNEHKFLLRILRDYHLHIKENPHTLLSRFYGLHRVKLPGGKKIHFVIMNNLFPPHRDVHETYDLKGSAIGREYPEEKAAQKKGAVLKDLNWVHRGRELQLGPEKRAMFVAQVRSDVALLQRLNIMDYSLLIGLHDMKRGNSEGLRQDALQVVQPESNHAADGKPHANLKREPTTRKEREAFALRAAVRRSDAKALGSTSTAKLPERETSDRRHFIFYQEEGGYRSTDEDNEPTDWIYYFGIIDTLTLYTSVKRGEHYWKSIMNNSKMISSIHPIPYGKRFCDFLFSVIKGADQSHRPRME